MRCGAATQLGMSPRKRAVAFGTSFSELWKGWYALVCPRILKYVERLAELRKPKLRLARINFSCSDRCFSCHPAIGHDSSGFRWSRNAAVRREMVLAGPPRADLILSEASVQAYNVHERHVSGIDTL